MGVWIQLESTALGLSKQRPSLGLRWVVVGKSLPECSQCPWVLARTAQGVCVLTLQASSNPKEPWRAPVVLLGLVLWLQSLMQCWGNRQSQQRGLLDVRSPSPCMEGGGVGTGRDAQRGLAANVWDSFYFVLTFWLLISVCFLSVWSVSLFMCVQVCMNVCGGQKSMPGVLSCCVGHTG